LVKLTNNSQFTNYQKPGDLIGENGLLKQLTKIIVERALEGEMTLPLGPGKSCKGAHNSTNTRAGHSAKTLKGDVGALPLLP
jgi:putative transposase